MFIGFMDSLGDFMWLIITYLLNFADPCLNPSIKFCCLVIMFYPKKKSCSVDVLKFWKYNFLLVLLADAVRGWRDRERSKRRVPYSCKGHTKRRGYQTASIMWESDTVQWQMISRKRRIQEQKIGDENSERYKISLPEMKLPRPRTDPSSSASMGQNRRAHWAVSASVSPASQPFLFPNLILIQYPVNEEYHIVNQNKHLSAHIKCYYLVGTNVRIICFLPIDCLCSS